MANPTTNFGWVMQAATDLVTDLPADFDVFGQAVDTDFVGLKGGTTGQVLAKASATDLDFVWSADAAGMTNPMTTTGDVIYSSSGSTPGRLGVGADGEFLSVASGVPSWVAAPGGGKVVQIVFASTTTGVTNATSTAADTTLTATITPTSASNNVLVMVSQNGIYHSLAAAYVHIGLYRGATSIAQPAKQVGYSPDTYGANATIAINWLDSPATTSATTYKTQFKNPSGSGNAQVQSTGEDSSIVLMEVVP